jgi:hypothetical protein
MKNLIFIAFAIFTFLGCSNNGKSRLRISKKAVILIIPITMTKLLVGLK